MKIVRNADLSRYTTVRIGGTAGELCEPESREELTELIRARKPALFLGGGSNLLIAQREFGLVVSLRKADGTLRHLGDGRYVCGASVRLQTLIRQLQEDGFGGIEYLYSVPGLVGGAVVMNAGRGAAFHQTISDHLTSVTVLLDGEEVTLKPEACGFGHRRSVFQENGGIVLSAEFRFPAQARETTEKLILERTELCRQTQDTRFPNFGSVFSEMDPKVMRLCRRLHIGGKRVHFSDRTLNWLVNERSGTFDEAVRAIRTAERLHRLAGKRARREVVVWE